MPINPLYAKALDEASGKGREKFPSVRFDAVGDKVIGTIDFIGDVFDAVNKMYKEGEPEFKKFIKTQKVNLILEDGSKVSLYLNKTRMFAAIGAALMEADLSDLAVGQTLAFKFSGYEKPKGTGSPAMQYEARIIQN